MPTFPRKEVYFDKKQLEAHGFPTEVSEAFLRTADDTNCVVMSRAPGGAGTELIRQGYDLKGFLIKAKSCSWGPMAGFLCQIPALNKYGSEKIEYNYENHKKYLEYREKHKILETPAYIPLKINDERKDQILKAGNGFIKEGFFETQGNDRVVGLAFAPDDSVVVEFLMERSKKAGKVPQLWSLYHGNIFYRLKADGKYLPLLDGRADMDGKIDRKKMPAFFTKPVLDVQPAPTLGSGNYLDANPADKKAKQKENEKELDGLMEVSVRDVLNWQSQHLGEDYKAIEASEDAKKYFANSLIKIRIEFRPPLTNLYPICGAQNPFPPYGQDKPKDKKDKEDKRIFISGAEDSYKNAVTGDYDLFAVWPVKPPVGWQMLARLAEQQIAWATRLEQWKQAADSFKGEGNVTQGVSFFLNRSGKAFLWSRGRHRMCL